MPLTPADVRNKQFSTTRLRPGYDEAFLPDLRRHFELYSSVSFENYPAVRP